MKLKVYLVVLIIFFYKTTVMCQNNKYVSGIDKKEISTWEQERKRDYKITELSTFTGDSAFRFYNCRQFVEILYSKHKITGKIVSFAKEYKSKEYKNKRRNERKILVKETEIDSLNLSKIDKLINGSNILTIPSGDSIKEWISGFDGITYETEYLTKDSYTLKSYWTPTAQDSTLIQAKQVQDFVINLESILNLQEEFSRFTNELPNGEYLIGVMTVLNVHKYKSKLHYKIKKFWQDKFHKKK